ncbi:MAG: hypothetical protein AB7S65_12555 [Sulfuricurvum sp.]
MPPKQQKSQEEIRGKYIKARVTADEYEEVNHRSKMYGVTTSDYLRNIALNYPLKSRVDQLAFLELQKCRGDLGRLGGLLKMWLSNKDRRPGLEEVEVKTLLKRIDESQEEITGYARELKESI